MSDGRRLWEEALQGASLREADFTTISGTRLGLSVVGQLARRYGLEVSFRSSSRGGTAVVLLLPQRIIKPMPAPTAPQPIAVPGSSAPAPAASRDTVPPAAGAPDNPAPNDAAPLPRSENGLPMRRRGRTLAAAERTRPVPENTGPPTSAKGFGAFRSAVRGEGPTDTPKET